jgi:hypothetical protein
MGYMKNLIIYISPTGTFDYARTGLSNKEAVQLAKVQIENSFQLGWKKQDIMLITNFPWEYGPIKTKVLTDIEFFEPIPQASKINAIVKLFEKGIIKDREIYWFHDLDAFQLEKITISELKLDNFDMALTDYGRMPRWSTGSIFFKKSAYDIFKKIKKTMYKDKTDEERALYRLTESDIRIRKRIKKLNKTYNFTPLNLRSCYKIAIKPLKVVHFHPLSGIPQLGVTSALNFYLGDNKIHTKLLTDRLIKILRYHRIT